MAGRTHIAIDTDVLRAQSSTLAPATSTLTRNAGVIRRLADVYDTCDLTGARALGA